MTPVYPITISTFGVWSNILFFYQPNKNAGVKEVPTPIMARKWGKQKKLKLVVFSSAGITRG
jgi:hypothetical protein